MRMAILETEIPRDYKNLPIIARGGTSIILKRDEDNVVMITRDSMKVDWLFHGLHITTDYEQFENTRRHDFRDFPVYAIEMPMLYKPDAKARKEIDNEVKFFESVNPYASNIIKKKDYASYMNNLIERYESRGMDSSHIYRVINFLTDYNPEQWSWDIARRQFAMDKNGKVVLVDPIVNLELLRVMRGF